MTCALFISSRMNKNQMTNWDELSFTGCFGQLLIWFLVILDEMKWVLIPELDLKAMYHWNLLTNHIDLFFTSNFQMVYCALFLPFLNYLAIQTSQFLRPILIYLPNELSTLKSGDVIHKIKKFSKWKSFAKIKDWKLRQ